METQIRAMEMRSTMSRQLMSPFSLMMAMSMIMPYHLGPGLEPHKFKAERGRRIPGTGLSKPYYKEINVGRNQPCPCGSEKKFKHCCLSKRDS